MKQAENKKYVFFEAYNTNLPVWEIAPYVVDTWYLVCAILEFVVSTRGGDVRIQSRAWDR